MPRDDRQGADRRAGSPPRPRASGRAPSRPARRAASTLIPGSSSSARTPDPSSRAIATSAAASTSSPATSNSPLSTPARITRGDPAPVALVEPRGDRAQVGLAHRAQPELHPEHPFPLRLAREAAGDSRIASARPSAAVVLAGPGSSSPKRSSPVRSKEWIERLLEQLLAGREVVMDERGGGAGALRHPRDPDLVDAVLGDQVAGGVEDPCCGVVAIASPPSARPAEQRDQDLELDRLLGPAQGLLGLDLVAPPPRRCRGTSGSARGS